MKLERLAQGQYPAVKRVDTARGHHYVSETGRVRNVTTIIHGGVPKNLTRWAARLAAESAYELIISADPPEKGALLDRATSASDRVRDSSAERGTRIHDFAEKIFHGYEPDVPEELVPWTEGAVKFLDDCGWRTFATEVMVWSDDPWYAGTVDAIFEDERGRLRLADTKTGKGVYQEFALQLAAYRHAKYIKIGSSVYRMPTIYSAGIIHLPGNWSYDYWAVNASDETFDVFRSVHQVSGWLARKKEEVLSRWDVTDLRQERK